MRFQDRRCGSRRFIVPDVVTTAAGTRDVFASPRAREARRAFVDPHVQAQAAGVLGGPRGIRQRGGSGAGAQDDLAHTGRDQSVDDRRRERQRIGHERGFCHSRVRTMSCATAVAPGSTKGAITSHSNSPSRATMSKARAEPS